MAASWLLLAAGLGCGGESTGDSAPAPDDEAWTGGPAVEEELPDGDWSGELARSCGGEAALGVEYSVRIADDVLTAEFDDGEFQGVSLDTFIYTGVGAANWMGLDGTVIGTCTAEGSEFACQTRGERQVHERRTLTFGEGRLRWEAEIEGGGEGCAVVGVLVE